MTLGVTTKKAILTVHIYINLRMVYPLMYEKMPVYNDLTKAELLMKCLHGKTQNANETFRGMIWNRVYFFLGGGGGSCILFRDDDNPRRVN